MTSTPKKSSEAEDVLEFLASLPESDQSKLKDLKDKKAKNGNADDSDILDFLDELEANDQKKKKTKDIKSEEKKDNNQQEPKQKEEKSEEKPEEETKGQTEVSKDTDNNNDDELPELNDPITSLSNWWSSSGSATVNSFWSNATQQANNFAQKATEEASKFAKDNNLDESFKKLQNLQIDEETRKKILNNNEEINLPDPSRAFGFLTKNLTNVLNSIVQTDEILKIQLIHDLENFNNLDQLLTKNFRKVIKQVQGGIKIELNKNSTLRNHNKRNLNLFNGKLIDGEKLAFANLENSINSFKQEEIEDEVRSSKLFISILPIHISSTSGNKDDIVPIDNQSNGSFSFTIILKDITHDITIITRSQAFPIKWAHWLDGSVNTDDSDQEKNEDENQDEDVDPSEWVKDWIDDGLSLTFGVLAQTYVVKRMGYD
ncbi:unnamed protein product [Wickerhamomyces anomalus]